MGFLGSYAQGWFKYYVAKNHGQKLLKRSQKLNSKLETSSKWFDNHPELYLTIYKFMYGMTTVILVLSGIRGISYLKFAIYSAISSLMWVAAFGFAAYYCADALLSTFDKIGDFKQYIIGALIVLGLLVFYIRHRRHLKHCIEAISE